MLIDLDRCVGCYACQVSCKSEHDVPFGTFRCRVETHLSGSGAGIRKFFLPRLCNHCENAPCIESCSEKALVKDQDGIVVFDPSGCSGCRQCHEKCPYQAIDISPASGQPEKCDFCSDRVARGLLPACVLGCMGKAMLFGDMNDPKSAVSLAMKKHPLKVIAPEHGTFPSVFYLYKGADGDAHLREHTVTEPAHVTRRVRIRRPASMPEEKGTLIYTSDAMCPSECGIRVLVEDGTAKKIYGNPHTLINNGTFCAKGASGLQLTYSENRIKSPLIRTGERGGDAWREISWEEASDHIAKKLIEIKTRFGPEAVFLDTGDVTDREAYYRLFHAFGTPNTYNHGSICDPNRRWGFGIMTGDERPLPDVQRPVLTRNEDGETSINSAHDAKLILNIGANPFVSTRYNYMTAGIVGAKAENGALYIVADPAFTASAAGADLWLPVLPGSDAALLAGMLYYIIQNDSVSGHKYIDRDFIKNYTTGWQEFRDAFLSHAQTTDTSCGLHFFTPEWTAEKTGIPAEDIIRTAHLFGVTKPASMEIGMHGTAHHTNGDVTSILAAALILITGNMDVPGGVVFTDSLKPKRGGGTSGGKFLDKAVSRDIGGRAVPGKLSELHKDHYGEYPAAWKGVLADLPEKIRNGVRLKHGPFRGHHYPIKAFISRAGNPLVTAGNTSDWTDAVTMKDGHGQYRLELFIFIDTHISVTGRYADIILPEAGYLERMGVSDVYTMSPELALRDRVIEPLHESKTPFGIMTVLSDALARNNDPDIRAEDFSRRYNDEEAFINEILSEAPGIFNLGDPLPYPDIPEGCMLTGTPDNPSAQWGSKVIRQGEPLTVDWLRDHNGVAVWPAAYYRYKRSGGLPSGIYPRTPSRKFEFRFSYLENINNKFGTELPVTFYWNDCRWNPKNPSFSNLSEEYPFQLISGRVHHAMTMTVVCSHLSETETECMKKMNEEFTDSGKGRFPAGSVSIPVFAVNSSDGRDLGIQSGDIITVETPLKKSLSGKAFLTEEMRRGVIKTSFGPGGQNASGLGFFRNVSGYTPNINECFDPGNISPFTGMPGFGDIMVRVVKGPLSDS